VKEFLLFTGQKTQQTVSKYWRKERTLQSKLRKKTTHSRTI